MSKSAIEWTDATWNPVTGCSKVSPGCKHCYAERMAKRLQAMGNPRYQNGFQVTVHKDRLEEPLRWKKPRRVFVNSMSDLLHPDIPWHIVDTVVAVMARCHQHTFQVLTKRPERLREHFRPRKRPLPNVWLGTSCEDQPTAEKRIPHLLGVPAAVRFLSLEPLLGPIDFTDGPLDPASTMGTWSMLEEGINWVIVGGESGPKARPMEADWVRGIRDQCLAAGVPFFFKQWGGTNKKRAGRILDGRTWDEFPEVGG
jgi:protein gp37